MSLVLNATALTAPGAVKPLVPRKPPLFPATTEASSALPRPSTCPRSGCDPHERRKMKSLTGLSVGQQLEVEIGDNGRLDFYP